METILELVLSAIVGFGIDAGERWGIKGCLLTLPLLVLTVVIIFMLYDVWSTNRLYAVVIILLAIAIPAVVIRVKSLKNA